MVELVDKQTWHDEALMRDADNEQGEPESAEQWMDGYSDWCFERLEAEADIGAM